MTDQKPSIDPLSLLRRSGLLRFVLALVVAIAGVLTAYHTTIFGLRAELNQKADLKTVSSIEGRLIHIEAILTERMATRAELQQTRDYLYEKLTAIEARLQLLP